MRISGHLVPLWTKNVNIFRTDLFMPKTLTVLEDKKAIDMLLFSSKLRTHVQNSALFWLLKTAVELRSWGIHRWFKTLAKCDKRSNLQLFVEINDEPYTFKLKLCLKIRYPVLISRHRIFFFLEKIQIQSIFRTFVSIRTRWRFIFKVKKVCQFKFIFRN